MSSSSQDAKVEFVNGANATTTLKLYWSYNTPGSISVVSLLSVGEVPFVSILFDQDQHKSDPRYWIKNPDRTLPTLEDGALLITTPNAALRYLAITRPSLQKLFPSKIKRQARVNAALDWSLFVLRKAAKDLNLTIELNRPQFVDEYWGTNSGYGGAHTGKPNGVVSAIARLESIWLKKGRFVAGAKGPNIADFTLWADFTYLVQVYKLQNVFFAPDKYPQLVAWDGKIRALLNDKQFSKALLPVIEGELAKLAATKPEPPAQPVEADLPWKDYK
jgi:glutathione S-transferase